MRHRRLLSTVAALGAATALVAPMAAAAAPVAAATGSTSATGTRSLAEVLTSDGNRFDRNWRDYDLVTEAVLAVLEAKPDSAVGVLTDGTVALTAFVPNDRAFQLLVKDLTGRWYWSEQRVFTELAGAVGIDAIEQVLLYHVVPGATLTKRDAAAANGATLTTAQGGTIGVQVYEKTLPIIRLRDQDRDDLDPFLNPRNLDLNKGNAQIAHGVLLVLRPLDL